MCNDMMNEEVNSELETGSRTDMSKRKKKPSRWSYERHLVKCPHCDRNVLDHMTECPFCHEEITAYAYKPLAEGSLKTVKIVATAVLIIIAVVLLYPLLSDRLGKLFG